MPLDESLRKNVGFVWGDIRGETDGKVRRGPVGTFFLVTVPSERFSDRRYGYAVTAAHVVVPENSPELRILSADAEMVSYTNPQWMTPFPDRDIAVAEYPGDELPHNMVAVPLDSLATDVLGWTPRLGATVYYVGLLAPIEEMAHAVVPMVRTGSIGTLNQPGVRVERQAPQVAHLIDVRSRKGFSGSPCWMETSVVGPGPIPKIGSEEAPTDLSGFSVHHYTQALVGILIGHVDEWGVGVVLPIEQLREVLNHEEVKSVRDENDARIAKNRGRTL